MIKGALFLAAAIFVAGAAQAIDRSPDAQLARMIAGRVEGPPVDCLNLRDIRSSTIIDGIAIVYETSNRTVYVNRPTAGASSLRWGQTLVTDTHTSQLCSIDVVKLYDTSARMATGFVGLGKFVPYTRGRR